MKKVVIRASLILSIFFILNAFPAVARTCTSDYVVCTTWSKMIYRNEGYRCDWGVSCMQGALAEYRVNHGICNDYFIGCLFYGK